MVSNPRSCKDRIDSDPQEWGRPAWTRSVCTTPDNLNWLAGAIPSPDSELDALLDDASEAFAEATRRCLEAIEAPTHEERKAGLCSAIILFVEVDNHVTYIEWLTSGWRDHLRPEEPPVPHEAPSVCR